MKREMGFSLIELLVAMAVTLIIVAATLGLFVSALHTNESSQQLSNMNGNLRSAMNLITRDLLQAGQGIPTGGVPLPINGGCSKVNQPVPVGTATFPYGCLNPSNPTLPAVIPGNALGPAVPSPAGGNLGSPNLSWIPSPGPNSDIITMLYQDNTLITDGILNGPILTSLFLNTISSTQMTFSNARLFTVNNSPGVGDIFLVTGSTNSGPQSRFVVVTAVNGQTVSFNAGDPFNLNQQATAANGTIQDLNADFGLACPDPPYPSPLPAGCVATAQRILMVSYWLDITQVVNGQVIPRLMRQVGIPLSPTACSGTPPPLTGCPRSVAEVIEGLELSYDYVNGTTPVNNQVSSAAAALACTCTISDNQIRKVNLYLAGRSDAQLSQNGQYLRNNVATQIDIRSLAFKSRYN